YLLHKNILWSKLKLSLRLRRQIRIRAKISGTASRPRLSIYRSNTNIYAQLIDDTTGKTLGAFSDLKLEKAGSKVEMSQKVGEAIAKIAAENKITTVVFDRGGFAYHGRVKALADSARQAGLQF
ncbi:MAG: 50S ribosomal protein L18, partial [Candidatus Gracilibacteria bacterium]|nr:50S ribosomal protein L18 [Candidatus Gracilibacteria bacterium]